MTCQILICSDCHAWTFYGTDENQIRMGSCRYIDKLICGVNYVESALGEINRAEDGTIILAENTPCFVLIGTKTSGLHISRAEVLRILKETIDKAEQERLDFAEEEAKHGPQYNNEE